MCRMILAVGDVQLYSILRDLMVLAQDQTMLHELNEDLGLGSWTHGDGWGVAYLQQGQWVVIKSINQLFDDPDVERLKGVKTTLAVLHARKRIGNETSFENTSPFIENSSTLGECIFCHNGYVHDEIMFDKKFKLKGNTDSEKLFYSILTDAADLDISAAIRHNFQRYHRVRGTNIILASKENSYVGVNHNILPRYYQMVLGRSEKMLVISSEKLPSFSHLTWKDLEAGDIVTVDNKTLEVKVVKEREMEKVLKKLS